jgi:hypothetical protein
LLTQAHPYKSRIFARDTMPTAIGRADGSAPNPSNGSNNSIHSGSNDSNTEIVRGRNAATAQTPVVRAWRVPKPSAKVLDNQAQEGRLQDDRSDRQAKRQRTAPSEASKAPPPAAVKPKPAHKGKGSTAFDAAPAQKPSASSRFKRTDSNEATERCDFTSLASINFWFPTYAGKSQINIPLVLLSHLSSDKAKAKRTISKRRRRESVKQKRRYVLIVVHLP